MLSFLEKELESAGSGIAIHLPIPARLLERVELFGYALEVFRWQAGDCGLDLLDAVHGFSLRDGIKKRLSNRCLSPDKSGFDQ